MAYRWFDDRNKYSRPLVKKQPRPNGGLMVIEKTAVEVGEEPKCELDTELYESLAKSIGWGGATAAIRMETRPQRLYKFRQFLAENGICVFDEKRVREYMDAEVAKVNKGKRQMPQTATAMTWAMLPSTVYEDLKHWVWVPLGPRSATPAEQSVLTPRMFSVAFFTGSSAPTSYEKPIPIPVLMTAKTIKDEFPDATFEVTDIVNVPKPDPFLAVVYEGQRFIIERWDEPGFRM